MLLSVDNLKTNENKVIDLCLSAINNAAELDIHVFRNSLSNISADTERIYNNGQQADTINAINKLIKQIPGKLTIRNNSQEKEINEWTQELQSQVSEWKVLAKSIKKGL